MAILIRGLVCGELSTPVPVVDWSTGDINSIKKILFKAKAGALDISSVWSIGQGRVVTYINTSITGNSSSEWILTDFNNTTSGGTAYTAWIHTKDLLGTSRQINPTKTINEWKYTEMRTNIIPKIYNALPSDFKQLLIDGTHIVSSLAGTENLSDKYYLTLHTEKEVFGLKTYARDNESNVCKHLVYFQTANNRRKSGNSQNSGRWWLRSPVDNRGGYCLVYLDGTVGWNFGNSVLGVCPAAII